MPTRTARVWLATVLALGFVLFRLLYAFLFSGLAGNQVLLDLPTLRLSGPFRAIELFGPISAEGIYRNISLALPFALLILTFGILTSFIDLAKLNRFSKRLPRIGWLITTITVSLSSIPYLAVIARRLDSFRKLRGERRLAIISPLFERAVGRAMATALEMSRSEPQTTVGAALRVSGLNIDPIGPIDLDLDPGDIVLLSGATGAGKSTLLRALAGETLEHDTRTSAGHVFIGDTEITSFSVGSRHAVLVPQLPQEGSLESEVSQNGIFSHGLAGKPVATLSHGEAYRLALDEAMKRSPTLLLLDEPAAALDEAGVSMLVDQLNKVSSLGTTIVIAEHRIGAFENIATKKYQLSAGRLLPGTYVPEPSPPVRSLPLFDRGQQLASIQIRELPELISAANIELHLGECLAITGHNGAGKSTLLRALATNLHVSVSVLGRTFDGYDPTSVALVPDLPASFFVTDSLENELRRADRVASAAPGLTRLTFESILGESVAPRLSTHPLDLSSGTQLALAVAMQLSHKPQLLLLDEPVQGLDPKARQLMAETIRCVQETGCAVIFATHDLEFAHSLADRVFEINERKLRQISQEVL